MKMPQADRNQKEKMKYLSIPSLNTVIEIWSFSYLYLSVAFVICCDKKKEIFQIQSTIRLLYSERYLYQETLQIKFNTYFVKNPPGCKRDILYLTNHFYEVITDRFQKISYKYKL